MEATSAGTPDKPAYDRFVHQVVDDWRRCPLTAALRQMLEFAEQLTRTPAATVEGDIAALRAAGWSDRAIHDAVQVISYFNYINRVADGLGVEPERDLPEWGGSHAR